MKALFLTTVLAATCSAINAQGQIVNDPTRPPPGIYESETSDAAKGPVLQSVMITSTERSAIIGGERVKLGGKYGEARVIVITANEVVLRSPSGTETLRMYPDVDMKMKQAEVPTPAAVKPARKTRPRSTNAQGKQG